MAALLMVAMVALSARLGVAYEGSFQKELANRLADLWPWLSALPFMLVALSTIT